MNARALRLPPQWVLVSYALAIAAAAAQAWRFLYGESGRLGNDNWSNWTAIAWAISVLIALVAHPKNGWTALFGAPVALWSFLLTAIGLAIFILSGGII